MERLSDIPLRKILNNISYQDLMNLIKVPDVRNIVLSFYQNEINLRELEKRTIMDCIDELERNMETNLFMELIDYFESKSYRNIRSLPEYNIIQKQFYDEILNLDIDEATRKIISDIQLGGEHEIYEIPYVLEKKGVGRTVRAVVDKYQNRLDKLEMKEMEKFKKMFFKGPKSYENVNEYLEKVKEYVQEYLVEEDERQVKEDFLNCVSKVKNIRTIFNRARPW